MKISQDDNFLKTLWELGKGRLGGGIPLVAGRKNWEYVAALCSSVFKHKDM